MEIGNKFLIPNSYKILIISGSGCGKINALLDLINHQTDIDNIYLYVKDPYKTKINSYLTSVDSKYCNNSKAFIEYLNDMDDIYENIEQSNPKKKRKILIAFDEMIVNVPSNKKLQPIVTELFIRGRKLSISFIFTKQFYFVVPKATKFYTLFYYENSKQKRTSTNNN